MGVALKQSDAVYPLTLVTVWRTDLVQHAQDVLLALSSHHRLCLTDGVDVKPRLKATQKTCQREVKPEHGLTAHNNTHESYVSHLTAYRYSRC